MAKIDADAVNDLKTSFEKVGQLYTSIVCLQHAVKTDTEEVFVIAGRHRMETHTARPPYKMDVDTKAKELGISHGLCHWVLRQHANIQRVVPEEERKEELVAMAEILAGEGTDKDKIAGKLIAISALSARRVRELLPPEYKEADKAEAGRLGGAATSQQNSETEPLSPKEAQISPIPKEHKSPWNPPDPKSNNPSQFTGPAVMLFLLVKHIKGTNFLQEEPFLQEKPEGADEYVNNLTREGIEKSFQPDIVDYKLKLRLEAEGEAHRNEMEDATKKDEQMQRHGWEVLKFANRDIERSPHLILQIVNLKVELMRLQKRMEVRA